MPIPLQPRMSAVQPGRSPGAIPRKTAEITSPREERPLLRFPGERLVETITLTAADRLIVSSAITGGTLKKSRQSGLKLFLLGLLIALAGLGGFTLFRAAADFLTR